MVYFLSNHDDTQRSFLSERRVAGHSLWSRRAGEICRSVGTSSAGEKMRHLKCSFRRGTRLMQGLLLFAATLFAGQSLVFNAGQYLDLADPQYPRNQSWRVEFQVHDWTEPATGSGRLISLSGLGFAAFIGPNGSFSLESAGDRVLEQQPCFVNANGMSNALIRFQRNVTTSKVTCEIWSYDSTGYNTQTDNIKTLGNLNFGGGNLGGGAAASLGFIHVFTTLLPLGSRPPVTADRGDWTDLRFDGNLLDSSGKGHNATGTGRYVTTPNQIPVALPKTLGAPFWSNSVSLRAGFPAQLDGSASFTLADGNSSVNFQWQQLSGPSTVIWQNRQTGTPTVTGLVFGTYTFRLEVTDAAGNKAAAPLTVGAVATDANGVIVNANPAADALFGPMIAFGRNPWGWADERNLRMENLQRNTYGTPPTWSAPAEDATVDYRFFNPYGTPQNTTLVGDITATALTIPVANAASLDLSSLPTQILLGNSGSWEIVRICSASANTLGVCYDGRGYHYGFDGSYIRPATAWSAGNRIWQVKVTGTDTHFLTTICSSGPGWPVASTRAITSAGTITVSPGSAAASGVGASGNGTQNSLAIAIYATHNGTPFTFLSYVNAANGKSIVMARPFPADADPGTYSYRIFSDQRRIVLHYTRTDSTDGSVSFPTSGCETDTALYLYFGLDNVYANQRNSASPYSYMDGLGYTGDVVPNYYDIGLAHYAFYFRSGLTQSLTSARNLEDYWLRYPEIGQGEAGGNPRSRSILGVFAAAVLDGDRARNWSGLRSFAKAGALTAQANRCDDDLRESAYTLSWLALAAQFDPDPAQRANWKNVLSTSAYSRDNGCKRPDNSFAAGNYWEPGPQQVTATRDSATVTPVSGTFPANICSSTAHGTAAASNGSALLTALTSSFIAPAGSYKLLVGGTIGGVRYDLSTQFDYSSPSGITMAALWPGDSGVVYWSIENNDNQSYALTIAGGPDDAANFGQITSCTLTDPTHIELYRPWPTPSGTFSYFQYNLVGRGTQPFMAGIKALQMRYAGQVYAPYKGLDEAVSTWVGTTGFDQTMKAIYYGRVFPQCEPAVTDSGIEDVQFRVVGCIESGSNPVYISQARARNAEAQNAMTVNYLANPTVANQVLGDFFYGATYGASGYTASGYFSDGVTASNLDDNSLGSYKWPGFFFGVGMAHQWPAARLGGVAPPQSRTVYISLDLLGGTSSRIIVTAPSGAQVTYDCGNTSPCPITVDDRQGSHWFQVQYLSPSGTVSSQTAPDLLALPVRGASR
jgi:PAS domain-containing protein